jgi:micrococcal nuclease
VTFLNSHDPYQGRFYVAVSPDDYGAFPEPPALYFPGKCVVVQGTVELYRGSPQIVLRSPDDMRVLE